MPQFDPTTFPTQLFWLAVTFVALYLAMARWALPRVAQVLEQRRSRIDSDLEKAEKLTGEAKDVLAAYEKTMADARSEAQKLLQETQAALAEEAAKRHQELNERIAEQTRAAESRIEAAREKALANVRQVAAEAAEAAAAKLIGARPERDKAEAAVDAVMKRQS